MRLSDYWFFLLKTCCDFSTFRLSEILATVANFFPTVGKSQILATVDFLFFLDMTHFEQEAYQTYSLTNEGEPEKKFPVIFSSYLKNRQKSNQKNNYFHVSMCYRLAKKIFKKPWIMMALLHRRQYYFFFSIVCDFWTKNTMILHTRMLLCMLRSSRP